MDKNLKLDILGHCCKSTTLNPQVLLKKLHNGVQ